MSRADFVGTSLRVASPHPITLQRGGFQEPAGFAAVALYPGISIPEQTMVRANPPTTLLSTSKSVVLLRVGEGEAVEVFGMANGRELLEAQVFFEGRLDCRQVTDSGSV